MEMNKEIESLANDFKNEVQKCLQIYEKVINNSSKNPTKRDDVLDNAWCIYKRKEVHARKQMERKITKYLLGPQIEKIEEDSGIRRREILLNRGLIT